LVCGRDRWADFRRLGEIYLRRCHGRFGGSRRRSRILPRPGIWEKRIDGRDASLELVALANVPTTVFLREYIHDHKVASPGCARGRDSLQNHGVVEFFEPLVECEELLFEPLL